MPEGKMHFIAHTNENGDTLLLVVADDLPASGLLSDFDSMVATAMPTLAAMEIKPDAADYWCLNMYEVEYLARDIPTSSVGRMDLLRLAIRLHGDAEDTDQIPDGEWRTIEATREDLDALETCGDYGFCTDRVVLRVEPDAVAIVVRPLHGDAEDTFTIPLFHRDSGPAWLRPSAGASKIT